MKKYIKYTLVMFSLFNIPLSYSATGDSGWRDISQIGCHLNGGTCYVSLDINVGPAECSSNSIRWNKDSSTAGKEIFSLLMAASAANKKVSFQVSDQCYGNFPTFSYLSVLMK
ncbi:MULTISPECIES: hypothetical protein [Photobacterium]|uniref:Uncharacterized protein n=1 Tax=Photobacterium carnosum TaxID=2023717 RepID=A0A2N4UM33_9GAMM|nr:MULTISPECIES: hypothetical protein [Photobacterium]MBY3789041.1 hypothetical protein [Photobacterium carnosum]MCD9463404.1 hypothetical protein [Photobacterium phosphoreum]MCD9513242.1 hypothetical protein [Photobacterium phosphoreum]MCD9535685.1 hypothetical protein [Photobacterium carnosum]OBU40932.1 hypothetical protein AYY26_21090 [Photobacterium phosphoreum]